MSEMVLDLNSVLTELEQNHAVALCSRWKS